MITNSLKSIADVKPASMDFNNKMIELSDISETLVKVSSCGQLILSVPSNTWCVIGSSVCLKNCLKTNLQFMFGQAH